MATRSTPTLAEAAETYLAGRELAVSATSLANDASLLNRLCQHVGAKQVGRLTAADIEGFLLALKRGTAPGSQAPAKAATLGVYLARLRTFVAYSGRKGWLRGDMLDTVKIGGDGEGRRDYLRLSADELLRLLDAVSHPRDRAIIATAMNTALRINEVVGIKLGNVDLDNREFYAKITKSHTSDVMPITLDLEAEMRTWLAWYAGQVGPLRSEFYLLPAKGRNRFPQGANRGAHVFGPLRPESPTCLSVALRVVKGALASLGYTPDQLHGEGTHTIRRSVARLYFDNMRVDGTGYANAIREVMALLHHKHSETTETYLGLDIEREARDRRMKGRPFITAMATASDNVRAIGGTQTR